LVKIELNKIKECVLKKSILLAVIIVGTVVTCVALLTTHFGNSSSSRASDSHDNSIEAGVLNSDKPGDHDWKLVWSDDFDGDTLDTGKWNPLRRVNNYNNELQCYLPDNVSVQDGFLYLTANKEKKAGKNFTSGLVDTKGKLSVTSGKLEARIKLPPGKGFLPAFWLLSERTSNEIDIMESIEAQTIYGTNHYLVGKTLEEDSKNIANNNPDDFHTYSLEWNETELKWFFDGQLYHDTTVGVPNEKMYIILNLAVGGDWPGSPDRKTAFPATMAVDYVKLYQHS
jgi:Beta-glucanase/Beta-glucan synthetase